MKVIVSENSVELGKAAAKKAAQVLNDAIAKNGSARMVMSTGASQFDTITALIDSGVDWSKVEMFHLDEYIGMPETHIASFRKYLKERFVSKVNLKRAVFVNGEGDVAQNIKELSAQLLEKPVDLGLIGIGENAHLAFNDPPADFNVQDPYIVVNLSETCKKQQVREGWFATLDDVPKQAISMSIAQILKCKVIISAVPHEVKAKAVHDALVCELINTVPATALKTHSDAYLYLDKNSASQLDAETLAKFQ